jgi:eukaryotic-like serine/threonine-protein kinase
MSQDTPAGDTTVWPTVRRLGPDGRYHLEERLAAGGAATVWRAYDEQLDRSVAIKILHPHLVGDEDTVRRFERESRNAARLHHPNAIQIYDSGRLNDVVYLVMEFVDGPTLKEVLDEHGALGDWRAVAAIGEQIAAALSEAHAQGLIHRDIKPANILFTSEGMVKVVDFGIAKALTGATIDLTVEGTTVGTATYIAPEQYTGTDVDARADIYAMGMVLYECLTGRPAYSGDTPTATAAARLTREILPPRQVRADIDRRLEDVIVRCTRRDPDERFGDVATVAHALRRLNSDVEPHELTRDLLDMTPPVEPIRPEFPDVDPHAVTDPGMPTGPQRNRMRIALAFLAGMALTVLVIVLVTRNGGPLAPADDVVDDALPILSAADYDPWGGDGENPDQVPLSYDSDVTTIWYTEAYRTGLAGANKPGVGIWFELGDQPVSRLDIDFVPPGATFQVFGSDQAPEEMTREEAVDGGFVGHWGSAIGSWTAEQGSGSYRLEERQTHQYWLVWFSQLPTDESVGSHRVGIANIKFLGPTDAAQPSPTADATE